MGACCWGGGSKIAPVEESIWAPDGVGIILAGGISSRGFGISDSGRKGIYVQNNKYARYFNFLYHEAILYEINTGLVTFQHV